MGQLRSDPNSVGARKTGRNSFPSEEAFLRFFLMNSFPESPLKRACLVYISTFWPESRKKKPSSLWFYIHPFISEELINTIEKMNQRSQEKGQRRQKEYFFFLCCWHSWASSGPSPISKVNFQSPPGLWWVSILVENRGHTQNGMVEERSIKLNYEGTGRVRNLARLGKRPGASLKGQCGQRFLGWKPVGIPETIRDPQHQNHLTSDSEIVFLPPLFLFHHERSRKFSMWPKMVSPLWWLLECMFAGLVFENFSVLISSMVNIERKAKALGEGCLPQFLKGFWDQNIWKLLLVLFSYQVVIRLCNPMDCSTSGLPVLHDLLEFVQTHVQTLSSPSPPAFNLSQHQGLFQWVISSYQTAKVLEFQHQSFQWILRTDFL